jgi:hypothetical protein
LVLTSPPGQLAVHTGLAEEALKAGAGLGAEEIVQPAEIARPHRHVRVRAVTRDVVALLVRSAPLHRAHVAPVVRGDIRLDSDDGCDPGGLRLMEEVVRAVQIAVIGHRDVRHAHLTAGVEHVLQPRRTVQQRILSVHMQMCERLLGHGAGHLRAGCCWNGSGVYDPAPTTADRP